MSRASVYNRLTAAVGLAYQRLGPRHTRRLEWEALRAHVGQYPDRTQKEHARHFGVSRHCIGHAQRQMAGVGKSPVVHRAQPAEKKAVSTPA